MTNTMRGLVVSLSVVFLMFSNAETATGQDEEFFLYEPIFFGSASEPLGPIILGSDGFFYGIGYRTIFRIDTNGTYEALQTLPSTYYRYWGLVEGSDGYFYGLGQSDLNGEMFFRMAPGGTSLTYVELFSDSDWELMFSKGITEGGDGLFYGWARAETDPLPTGAPYGYEYSIVTMNVDGDISMVGSPGAGSVGSIPPNLWDVGSLVTGDDGAVYGLIRGPSPSFCDTWGWSVAGTVFRVDGIGSFTTLYEHLADEEWRPSMLSAGDDGFVYGLEEGWWAPWAGAQGDWIHRIFSIDEYGEFTPEVSIQAADTIWFTQAVDGRFYGTASIDTNEMPNSQQILQVFRLALEDSYYYEVSLLLNDRASSWSPDNISLLNTALGEDGFVYGVLRPSSGPQELFRLVPLSPLCTDLEQQLADAQQTIAEKDAEISNLQTQISQLQGQVSDLTERVNTLTSEKADLEQQLASAQQTIAELTTEVSELQGQISQLQAQVVDLTNQVSNLISEKAALQSLLSQMNDNLTLGLASIQDDFRSVFKNPTFTIPGATNVEQYQNLIQTILDMSKGEKNPIYKGLRGPKR